MRVQRWDRGTFRHTKLDNGWLRADASLTRAGVFVYTQPDGSKRRELRLPEDVERKDSLSSLQLTPVTNGHPAEMLTAENTKTYQVGTVGSDVRVDGGIVRATVQVTDAAAVGDIETGAKRELSCGYNCELEHTPGTWQGQRYDAIQRHISYNHVALTPLGRAGRDIRIHLDAADAVMDETETGATRQDTGDRQMEHTIRLDGVDFEASKQAAQAFASYKERTDARVAEHGEELAKAQAEKDATQAKLDAATEELAKVKQEREDAMKPERITEAVRARLGLERSAAKVLGEEKLDEMTEQEIMSKVILKAHPEAKLDDKSADYLRARFDAALEVPVRNDALASVRQDATKTSTETRIDAAEARRRMMEADDKRWMPTAEKN
jgi:hypothetical protein